MQSLVLVAALVAPEASAGPIVVTATRADQVPRAAPASATTIDEPTLRSLDLPQAADALRLLPGISVSVSGPRGSQTQLRLRGAEANHTLLFLDGIRLNDPAAGNEARFELLGTDLLSSVDVILGTHSALWGPGALGGVISVRSPDPLGEDRIAGLAEYGGNGSARASAQVGIGTGNFGVTGTASWLSSEGIDALGRPDGDRDGFQNRSLGLNLAWRPASRSMLEVSSFYVAGTSEFDGFDPATFRRADTRDETANQIAAARAFGSIERSGWTVSGSASILDSSNRNRLAEAPLNRTDGRRVTTDARLSRRVSIHRFIAGVEHEAEDFRARDQIYFGGTDQDRSRSLSAVVGEWHAGWSSDFSTSLAVRHDAFSAFEDATTVRASAMLRPSPEWTLLAAWADGVAQPTFYDLYGFFPGSFVGNPDLRPERSSGWELAVHWQKGRFGARAAAYSNRLRSEIVDVFDPATFLSSTRNAPGTSRRRGAELSAYYRDSDALRLFASYTFLDARDRREAGDALIREVRRPRHSASFTASGETGRLSWSATAAYVGARTDTDFDLFQMVRLGDYVLGTARLGWELNDGLEAYARVENALDADYRDVAGYATAGRTVHAGLRLRFGS